MKKVMASVEQRYIQHPSSIPLEYSLTNTPAEYTTEVVNGAAGGGLSFHTTQYLPPKQWLHLSIPINKNHFEADAQVRWCQKHNDHQYYNVGVTFSNIKQAFSMHMIEQVCYIEKYRIMIKHIEGRELSNDQAAAEWIERYAEEFAQTGSP